MRIAIVGNFGLTGNQTMAVRALPIARSLAARGHELRVALPARTDLDVEGTVKYGPVDVRTFSSKLPFGPRCQVLQTLGMALWCIRWRPESLYCFKPVAHSGAIAAIFIALRRIGVYRGSVVLDTDDWEGFGGWNEKRDVPSLVKRFVAWQERWSLRHADAVVAASLELSRKAAETGAKRVSYVPNCPREMPAPAAGAERAGSGPTVLVYTRFVEYSLDRLVATFKAIAARVPHARFVVAGTGLKGEERGLRDLLAASRLSGRCRVLGWVTPDKLPGLFAAADVALYLLDDDLLNRTKCPMKLVELVSAGVPVVADAVGQAREYVEDGQTGILVTPGDVEKAAEAVASLLSDPARRQAMSEAARQRAERRWRWSAWAPAIEKSLGGEIGSAAV